MGAASEASIWPPTTIAFSLQAENHVEVLSTMHVHPNSIFRNQGTRWVHGLSETTMAKAWARILFIFWFPSALTLTRDQDDALDLYISMSS